MGNRVPRGAKASGFCGGLWFELGVFRQEGWRLENEDPSDADTPLIFKGVVFNEMKGAFVSPHVVLMQFC